MAACWRVLRICESLSSAVKLGLSKDRWTFHRLVTWKRGANGKPPRVEPLFPGYIFVLVDLDEDAWWTIQDIPGVIGWIQEHDGGFPAKVVGADLDMVLARSRHVDAHTSIVKKNSVVVNVGGRMLVSSGPLAGTEVTMTDDGKLMTPLGRLNVPAQDGLPNLHERCEPH